MKKYYVECIDNGNSERKKYIYFLYDLSDVRFTREHGLYMNIIAATTSQPLNQLFFLPDGKNSTNIYYANCKVVKFKSNKDAILWFEINYK